MKSVSNVDPDYSQNQIWKYLWKNFIELDPQMAHELIKDKNLSKEDLDNPSKLDKNLVTNIISMVSLFLSQRKGVHQSDLDAGVVF